MRACAAGWPRAGRPNTASAWGVRHEPDCVLHAAPGLLVALLVLLGVVVMLLDALKTYGAALAAAAFAAAALAQSLRLHTEQLAHADLKVVVARQAQDLARAALAAEQRNTGLVVLHTQQTQENLDVFTSSQPARDARAGADRDRLERLRADAERRAATYRAMSQASAAACAGAADRLAALDQHVVAGVAVVAELRAGLDRRDAEVTLLKGQLDADRALWTGALHE